ncbi:MAG: TonB-dependent receptor [Candidatus Eiseniibacteriota bacterium]
MRPANLFAPIVLVLGGLGSFASEVAAASGAGTPGGTLELSVVDAGTGRGIPFATVLGAPPAAALATSGDGVLRLDGVTPGSWTVRATHVAYEESAPLRVELRSGETTRVTILLHSRLYEVAPVEVTAERDLERERIGEARRTLLAEEGRPLPNPADDAFRMVRVLPGVTADEAGAEFHVRGGDTDETLVRVDGVELRQLFHGRDYGGITGVVPFAAVEQLDVYPGGFPARFGDKLSGVIDVRLRDGGRPGTHGTVGVDAVSSRAFVERHDERASWMASVREGYLDRVLRALRDDLSVESAYRDLLLRGVLRGDSGRRLSVNYLRSEDHVFYDEGIEQHTVNSDYVDHYAWATAGAAAAGVHLDGTLHWARSIQARDVMIGDRDDQDVERVGARLEAAVDPGGGHLLTVGGSAERETGSFRYHADEVVVVSATGEARTLTDHTESGRFDRVRSSLFVQDAWRIMPSVEASAGLRATRATGAGKMTVDPRASAAWQLGRGFALHGAWGVYGQAPKTEIDLEEEVQVRSARHNRAVHRVVGVERTAGALRVGVDGWDKSFTALDGVVTRTMGAVVERHVVREGRAHGVEAFVHRKTASENWWFSYTLGRSEWGTDGVTFSRDFDRLHAFSLTNTFAFSPGWDLGMAYSFHSGTPYTEQSWSRDGLSRQWVLEEGSPNGERLPAYHRIDVRVRRHFRFNGWEMTAYAEGLNLTNHENVLWYAWRFADRDGDRVPERITRTGIPGIPSVGVEVRF